MPNWCTTNYVVKGSKDDLCRLVKTLNNMPQFENGFGKFWMGNLFGAFGMSRDEVLHSHISCRGVVDPDFYAVPCFFGPRTDDSAKFSLDDNDVLRLSTTTAWSRSEDFEKLILKHFPSITLAWSSTDEFGNFHYTHNPEDIPELAVVALDGLSYARNEVTEFKFQLKDFFPALDFEENVDMEYFLSDEFKEKLDNARKDFEAEEDAPSVFFYESI